MEYIKNSAKISLFEEKCIGCGICKTVCPHGVFEISHGKAYFYDKDKCIECGACDINCPTHAIEVEAGVGCANALINSWIDEKKSIGLLSIFGRIKKVDDKEKGCC